MTLSVSFLFQKVKRWHLSQPAISWANFINPFFKKINADVPVSTTAKPTVTLAFSRARIPPAVLTENTLPTFFSSCTLNLPFYGWKNCWFMHCLNVCEGNPLQRETALLCPEPSRPCLPGCQRARRYPSSPLPGQGWEAAGAAAFRRGEGGSWAAQA